MNNKSSKTSGTSFVCDLPEIQSKDSNAETPSLLMRIEDVAASLRVSRAHVYASILPHLETVRLGSRHLVVRASLEAFVAAHTSGKGA